MDEEYLLLLTITLLPVAAHSYALLVRVYFFFLLQQHHRCSHFIIHDRELAVPGVQLPALFKLGYAPLDAATQPAAFCAVT